MITLKAPKYTPELRGNSTKSFLQGNKFNKITARLPFEVKVLVQASTTIPIEFGYGGDVDVIHSETFSATPLFGEFRVGDLIEIQDSASNDVSGLVVTEIIDSTTIKVLGALTSETSTACKIVNITPFAEARYYFNLIENSATVNYISKTDLTSVQVCKATLINTPDDYDFVMQPPKTWHIGSAYITYVGYDSDTCAFSYEIVHELFISPLYLGNSFTETQNGNLEPYFEALQCLKHVYKVEMLNDAGDPNRKQTAEYSSALGNTGGYGENFNGNATNYAIEDLAFTDFDDVAIDTIELPTLFREALMTAAVADKQTGFSFKIVNATDSPFLTTTDFTKVILNFVSCIELSELDAAKTITENNVFDRCTLEQGDTGIDGENASGLQQIFKDCSCTRTSDTELLVEGKILMTSAQMIRLRALTTAKKYEFSVSIFVANENGGAYNGDYNADYDITTATTDTSDSLDTVTLLIDANDFLIQKFDADLIAIRSTLKEHPDTTIAKTTCEAFPGDELLFQSVVAIDTNDRDLDLITFQEARLKIISEHTDGTTFDLDSFAISLSGVPKVGGLAQIAFAQDRNFVLPDGDENRTISMVGSEDLTGGVYGYTILFPILFRWEYWLQLLSVNDEFFDVAEPLNGKNHFWFRFKNSDWTIKFKIEFDVLNDGELGTYTDTLTLPPKDYETNTDYSTKNVKTFDLDDVELTDGTFRFIQNFADTKVVANFIKETTFDIDKIEMVIWMEVLEGGGITSRRRISSVDEVGDESWFKSSDTSNKIVIANPSGNLITGTCLIDYTKLPVGVTQFRLYARLYDSQSGSATGGGTLLTTPNGNFDSLFGITNWELGPVTGGMEVIRQGTVWTPPAGSPATYYGAYYKNPTGATVSTGSAILENKDTTPALIATNTYTIKYRTVPFGVIPGVQFRFKAGTGVSAWITSGTGVALESISVTAAGASPKLAIEFSHAGVAIAAGGYGAFVEVVEVYTAMTGVGNGGEETLTDAIKALPVDFRKERRAANSDISSICPFTMNVLAQTVGSDLDKNDFHAIYAFGFQGITDINFRLQKQITEGDCEDFEDIEFLNTNDFGHYYELGFVIDDFGKEYAGYLLDFQKILIEHGEGRYRVTIHKGAVGVDDWMETYPIDFCLFEYKEYLAEGTVIIRTYTSGIHGNIDYPKYSFKYPNNWYNEWRMRGVFGFNTHPLSDEKTEHTNRQKSQFKKTFTSKYMLKLKQFPGWLHNLLFTEVAQASETTISDFNKNNAFIHDNTPVNIAGGYEPLHRDRLTTRLPIDIEFENAYNQQDHRIC